MKSFPSLPLSALLAWSLALSPLAWAQDVPGTTPSATATAPASVVPITAPVTAQVQAYFSSADAQNAIVKAVNAATKTIRIQADGYIGEPTAKAMEAAQKRGVTIVALAQEGNQTTQYTGDTFLQNARVTALVVGTPAVAQSKIIILDGGTPQATVIAGGFDNLVVIKGAPDLVKAYDANFDAHLADSAKPGAVKASDTGKAPDTGEAGAVTGDKTNVNTASAKDLQNLPGIGKVTAQRIIEYREANGDFKNVADLDKVSGIGKATMEKIRDLVTVQ